MPASLWRRRALVAATRRLQRSERRSATTAVASGVRHIWPPHLPHVAGDDERTGRYAVYNSIDVPDPDELYEEVCTINVQSRYERCGA